MSPLGDNDTDLWSRVKAALVRKTMREVIFKGLNCYVPPVEIPAHPEKEDKEAKGEIFVVREKCGVGKCTFSISPGE